MTRMGAVDENLKRPVQCTRRLCMMVSTAISSLLLPAFVMRGDPVIILCGYQFVNGESCPE